jgi:hypothetical protein
MQAFVRKNTYPAPYFPQGSYSEFLQVNDYQKQWQIFSWKFLAEKKRPYGRFCVAHVHEN